MTSQMILIFTKVRLRDHKSQVLQEKFQQRGALRNSHNLPKADQANACQLTRVVKQKSSLKEKKQVTGCRQLLLSGKSRHLTSKNSG